MDIWLFSSARSSNGSILCTWCFMIKGGTLSCFRGLWFFCEGGHNDVFLWVLYFLSCFSTNRTQSLRLSFNFLQAKEIAAIQRSEAPMGKMPRQRGRWSQPSSSIEMTVKSMLDLRQLESFSVSRSPSRDSLSQNSNGDDREEQADLPVHIDKVRAVLLWGGGSTLSCFCSITCLYYYSMLFFVSLEVTLNTFWETCSDISTAVSIPAMCDSAIVEPMWDPGFFPMRGITSCFLLVFWFFMEKKKTEKLSLELQICTWVPLCSLLQGTGFLTVVPTEMVLIWCYARFSLVIILMGHSKWSVLIPQSASASFTGAVCPGG